MSRDNVARGFYTLVLGRLHKLVLISVIFTSTSCGLLKEREEEPSVSVKEVITKPLTPEQSSELLEEAGSNWFFGNGLGNTTLVAGSVFVFPPYALYVVGNGILSLSGYEPIYVSDALPEEEREGWNDAFNSVTAAPGRLTAAMAGREFRTQEVAKERINSILTESRK